MQIGRPVGLDFFAGLVMAALVGITPARADEPIFGFIYTTDLLPKDKTEFEQWMTWKRQKAHGSFNLLEWRSEFSYGITDAFQLSGYLNYDWTEANHNAVDGTTQPPEPFADIIADPNCPLYAFAGHQRFRRRDLEGPEPL
jgi:hypothetical protein